MGCLFPRVRFIDWLFTVLQSLFHEQVNRRAYLCEENRNVASAKYYQEHYVHNAKAQQKHKVQEKYKEEIISRKLKKDQQCIPQEIRKKNHRKQYLNNQTRNSSQGRVNYQTPQQVQSTTRQGKNTSNLEENMLNFSYKLQISQRESNLGIFSQDIRSQQDSGNNNQHYQIEKIILQKNMLVSSYDRPSRDIQVSLKFGNECSYINTLTQLLKYEIISSINQSLWKKVEAKKIVSTVSGTFAKRNQQNVFNCIFIPTGEQFRKIRFANSLLKGDMLCLASKLKQLQSHQIYEGTSACELCIVSYDLPLDKFQVATMNIIQMEVVHLFPIDPIVTFIRAFRAIQYVKYSIHMSKIIDPTTARLKRSTSIEMWRDKQDLNASQQYTIYEIYKANNGIHLVQGPPGTGKTSTILELMRYQRARKNNPIVMICSESNAAIDNIGHKIKKKGVHQYNISSRQVIRLGRITIGSQQLIDFNLKHLCEKQMRPNMVSSVQLQIQIEKQELKFSAIPNKPNSESWKIRKNIEILEKKILEINKEITTQKHEFNKIEDRILSETKIILSTLSSSGRERILKKFKRKLDCLIVDEACQTTEPNMLIPFMYDPDKVVLVGDPQQLEATVISDNKASKYHRSLFERFIGCGHEPFFLNVQYRMVPEISEFPNRKVYGGRLHNGRTNPKPASFQKLNKKFLDNSNIFMDLSFGKEFSKNKSYENTQEAKVAALLARKFTSLDRGLTVGIISPYSPQVRLINEQLVSEIVAQKRENVKVSTVDAFQGQERDVIIISCVRANTKGKVGFLNNKRRLNVGLTRAKSALIVLGHRRTLL